MKFLICALYMNLPSEGGPVVTAVRGEFVRALPGGVYVVDFSKEAARLNAEGDYSRAVVDKHVCEPVR